MSTQLGSRVQHITALSFEKICFLDDKPSPCNAWRAETTITVIKTWLKSLKLEESIANIGTS